jgi:hypothetical protein
MYALEFYIYHLRPYGIESGHQHLNVHGSHWIQNGIRTSPSISSTELSVHKRLHHHFNISMTVMIGSWSEFRSLWPPLIFKKNRSQHFVVHNVHALIPHKFIA